MNRFFQATALMGAAAALYGCGTAADAIYENPFKDVPSGYYTRGNQQLTPARVSYQDWLDTHRCKQYAEETVPSTEKLAGAWGRNGVKVGAIGGAAGGAAQMGILGPVSLPVVGADAAWSAINDGLYGHKNGKEYRDVLVNGKRYWCDAADAGGLHSVPPSIGVKIKNGQLPPQSFAEPGEVDDGTYVPPVPPAAMP